MNKTHVTNKDLSQKLADAGVDIETDFAKSVLDESYENRKGLVDTLVWLIEQGHVDPNNLES